MSEVASDLGFSVLDGRVRESGSQVGLMRKNSLYAKPFSVQARAYG